MKAPIITLKNVKTFRGMDGYGVNADVYIDGVLCFFALDEGCGGEMNLESYAHQYHNKPIFADRINAKIKEFENYIKTLPELEEPSFIKGETYRYKQTMETIINALIDQMEADKQRKAFERKRAKRMVTAIVWGKPEGNEYSYIDFKIPIEFFIPTQIQALQKRVDAIREKHCKDGVVILNTNLPKEIK
jgi:hypothetical protein